MRSHSQDSMQPNPDSLDLIQGTSQPLLFDWQNRWLKGHQYEHILKNAEAYSQKYGIEKHPKKVHPNFIYERPINGALYFVEGTGLGSDFGFPRVEGKKKFRWKKMNFPTNLPKTNPRVTYIVASTTNCHQINQTEMPLFRMHVVTLHEQESREKCGYILCHILEIKKKKEGEKLSDWLDEAQNKIDFYKLFAYLHNKNISNK